MKERLAGFVLMTAIVPLAVLGYLLLVWIGFFGRTERGRALKQLYEQRMDVLVRSGSLRAIFKRWKDHYPYDSAQESHHGTP